ncbi:hypothetical protein D3C73_993090 [compost metagenome]
MDWFVSPTAYNFISALKTNSSTVSCSAFPRSWYSSTSNHGNWLLSVFLTYSCSLIIFAAKLIIFIKSIYSDSLIFFSYSAAAFAISGDDSQKMLLRPAKDSDRCLFILINDNASPSSTCSSLRTDL